MTQALGWLYLLAGVASAIDAGRYSYAEWEAAQRNKNFWLVMLFFFVPLFLPFYLMFRGDLKQARITLPASQNRRRRGPGANQADKAGKS